MNEKDMDILLKALDLYEFTIKQRQTDKWDEEMQQFCEMRHHLGRMLDYVL